MDISTETDSWHTLSADAFETILSSGSARVRIKTEASEPLIERIYFDASRKWTGVSRCYKKILQMYNNVIKSN